MRVEFGKGKTEYGPGVAISLSMNEAARAIDAYLVARGVSVDGPRTVTFDREMGVRVYVDPIGAVFYKGKKFSGRGAKKNGR